MILNNMLLSVSPPQLKKCGSVLTSSPDEEFLLISQVNTSELAAEKKQLIACALSHCLNIPAEPYVQHLV